LELFLVDGCIRDVIVFAHSGEAPALEQHDLLSDSSDC
jgi:hypothetical protein